MVLIELLVLKLALDGILQDAKQTVYKQNLHKKERDLKSQLSELMIDYERGVIDYDTYNKKEKEVLSKLGEITKQYNI